MDQQTAGILRVLLAQIAAQQLLALILAVILGVFYRFYRRAYLRHWSLSWLALVMYVGASFVANMDFSGSTEPLRIPWVVVALVAGYLHVAWLLLGAWGLARGQDVPRRAVRLALVAASAAGLGSVLPALAGMTAPSAIGLRCFVAGLAYLSAAAAILSAGRHSRARAASPPGSPCSSTRPIRWPTSG